jgi:hypothetical protein
MQLLMRCTYHEGLSIHLFGEIYVNNKLGANRRIHFKASLMLITFIRGIEETHENLIIV